MQSVEDGPAPRAEFGTGLRERLVRASVLASQRRRTLELAALRETAAGAALAEPESEHEPVAIGVARVEAPRAPHAELLLIDDLGLDPEDLDFFLMLSQTVDGRESLALDHSRSIATLSADLATALGLDTTAAARVYLAGLAHDLGKIELSEGLLRKPGPLDRGEWRAMTSHPGRGAELVERVSGWTDVAQIVAYHHERWDGIGYPHGLSGEEIPLEARIVGAADAVVSMTTARPYRQPLTLPAALRSMLRQAGSAYDPQVVSGLFSLAFEGRLGL